MYAAKNICSVGMAIFYTRLLFRGAKEFLGLNYKRAPHRAWFSTSNRLLTEMFEAKAFEDIPSWKMLPVLGTAWTLLPLIGHYKISKLHLAALENRKRFGKIYREKFGSLNLVMISNPEDVETILRNEGPFPSRGETESLKTYRNSRKQWYSTTGLLLLQGKEWWELRSKTQKHLLKPKAVQAYLNPMQDVARDFIKKMLHDKDSNQEIPNFLGELYKWSLESVALVGLDTRLGGLMIDQPPDSESIKMINSVQGIFEGANQLEPITGNLPLWKYFRTPAWKKFEEAGDTFSEIAFKYINRSLEELKNNAPNSDKEMTLLQVMVTKGLDVSEAMVVVADMLFAGIDTTSHSVGFFLYMIAKYPDKQEILYQEIIKFLPSKENRINSQVFNELRYLKACIKESQRIMPVVGGMARLLENDTVLGGYKVPAGTIAVANLYIIGTDEQYYTKPDEFLPERWLTKNEKPHPFSFLPFGFGTRSCIGRRFAELEIICLITELIRNFKIEYHYEDIGLCTRLINAPDKPLRFTFVER